MSLYFWVGVALVAVGPPLVWVLGYGLARRARITPGRTRDFMPSLAPSAPSRGTAEFGARWLARRRRLVRRLLKRFDGGVEGVEAQALADTLGEPLALVESALMYLREAVPCRLRVTRRGRLLHDFAGPDLARLATRRRLEAPARLAWFTLGLLANLGAAWPLILTVGLGGFVLVEMWTSDDALLSGVSGLVMLAVFAGLTLLVGWVVGLLLRPLGGGLRVGDTLASELAPPPGAPRPPPRPFRRLGAKAGGSSPDAPRTEPASAGVGRQAALRAAQLAAPTAHGTRKSAGLAKAGGAEPPKEKKSSWNLGSFDMPDDPRGLLVIVVGALVLAVVLGAFSLLILWVRGIWRAAFGADDAPPGTAPARWVRLSHPIDTQSRLLPTNELVLRLTRALRRALSYTHPHDGELSERLVARARDQGGWLSALDLTLWEGLSPSEAARVGAGLAVQRGGAVEVTDGGELLFWLPGQPERGPDALPPADLTEYLQLGQGAEDMVRRAAQPEDRLVSNLPGVAKGHVEAGHRLAAGALLMAAAGLWTIGAEPVPFWAELVGGVALPLLALATLLLVGLTRHLVRALAWHGVLRDVRRAALHSVRCALAEPGDAWRASRMVGLLKQVFKPAAPGLAEATIQRELQSVAFDLDLDTDVDAARLHWSLTPLKRRLASIAAARKALAETQRAGNVPVHGDDDAVIFDSAAGAR